MIKPPLSHHFNREHGGMALTLLALLFAALCLSASRNALLQGHSLEATHTAKTPLYLPKARYIKLVTLGYNNFFSDILWFNTINYFGKEYLGTQDFRWMREMCQLVTTLDPQKLHVYEFCGSLLSWIAKTPGDSNQILASAIANHPQNWRFYYLRGFNYWYFLNKKQLAKRDFERAATLPDAPPFLASLASRLMVDLESPQVAIQFLSHMLRSTKDATVKKALTDKLTRAVFSRNQQMLQKAIFLYQARYKRKPDSLKQLVTGKILTRLPSDPFGGQFIYDKSSAAVTSSTGKLGLEFFGKTATTGLLKEEFAKHALPKKNHD